MTSRENTLLVYKNIFCGKHGEWRDVLSSLVVLVESNRLPLLCTCRLKQVDKSLPVICACIAIHWHTVLHVYQYGCSRLYEKNSTLVRIKRIHTVYLLEFIMKWTIYVRNAELFVLNSQVEWSSTMNLTFWHHREKPIPLLLATHWHTHYHLHSFHLELSKPKDLVAKQPPTSCSTMLSYMWSKGLSIWVSQNVAITWTLVCGSCKFEYHRMYKL